MSTANAIFGPVCLLALWTVLVLVYGGVRRVGAVVKGEVPRRAFELGESAEVPAELVVGNRHFMNLLEMPVLFYVVCLALFVTGNATAGAVALAWIYVALRLLHSVVHLTYNDVVHRLVPFALSNLVLLAMWLWLVARLA